MWKVRLISLWMWDRITALLNNIRRTETMEYAWNIWYWFKDRFSESSSWLALFIWFKEIGLDIDPFLQGHLAAFGTAGIAIVAFIFRDKG